MGAQYLLELAGSIYLSRGDSHWCFYRVSRTCIQIDSRLISKSAALSVFATNMAAGVAAAFAKLILKLFSETELDDFRMRNLECLLAHQMELSNARC
jgi:hypothetical protein